MRIGVLAVQGAFIEHIQVLESLGVETKEIRKKEDLEEVFDGFILPGGESSVMGKLLHDLDLFEPLKKMIEEGKPVFGTCAGMILLAKKLVNDDRIHLATMDIDVKRNAYGRQLGSFYTEQDFAGKKIGMPFIRAPFMESVGDGVEILSVVDEKIVAVRQGNQLVTAFHPEVTKDTSVHEYFINMISS